MNAKLKLDDKNSIGNLNGIQQEYLIAHDISSHGNNYYDYIDKEILLFKYEDLIEESKTIVFHDYDDVLDATQEEGGNTELELTLKKYLVNNDNIICKHNDYQIPPFRLTRRLLNNNRNKELDELLLTLRSVCLPVLLLILRSACRAQLLLFQSIFQPIAVIFEMSQLTCQVVRNNTSFGDYDDNYGNTRVENRYTTNNDNTVDIRLAWILKKN